MIDYITVDLSVKINPSFLQLLLIWHVITVKKNVTNPTYHEFVEKAFDIKSAYSFGAWPLKCHYSVIYLFLIIHI